MRAHVGLLVVFATACAPRPAPLSSPTASPLPSPDSKPAAPPETPVRLLDPGRSPLRVLRYAPPLGAHALLRFSASPGDLVDPGVAVTLDLHVSTLEPDGSVRIAVRVLDAPDALKDVTGEFELSARGTQHTYGWVSGFHYDHGGWADISAFGDGLQQAVGESCPVWPVEAVGVGARWTAVRQSGRSWAGATLTSTYALVAVDEHHSEVHVATTLAGERQWVQVPNQGDDVRYELLAMTGSGEADLRVPLDGVPFPLGRTDLAWTTDMRTDRGSEARGFRSTRATSSHAMGTFLRALEAGN